MEGVVAMSRGMVEKRCACPPTFGLSGQRLGVPARAWVLVAAAGGAGPRRLAATDPGERVRDEGRCRGAARRACRPVGQGHPAAATQRDVRDLLRRLA